MELTVDEDSPKLRYLKERLGTALLAVHRFRGDETMTIARQALMQVFSLLREDSELDFDFLVDITAVDYLGKKEPRFEVVYHLHSLRANHRLRVKVPVPEEDPEIESVTALWPGANWLEREVWDMYGIRFKGHPNLKRILLYEEFEGHPLRKDYPINRCQPLVPLRTVQGTFVDQRSEVKLKRLEHLLIRKP